MNTDDNARHVEFVTQLAQQLVQIPVDAPMVRACNGKWWFEVHRYQDGYTVLRMYMDQGGKWDIPFAKYHRRDIGRFFADPVDFINFILGDPSPRFVLEAMDL